MEPDRKEPPKQPRKRLRAPVCSILGHVDAGKTRLLDRIRGSAVQRREAGKITQRLYTAFLDEAAVADHTALLRDQHAQRTGKALRCKLPGLLFIDTPGHETFANLRRRASGLCDIAVLAVDLARGFEPQTDEALTFLRDNRVPFVVALTKLDRVYGWRAHPDGPQPFAAALAAQGASQRAEFAARAEAVERELQRRGVNSALYTRNRDFRTVVSAVPTSAATGDGVADLLVLLVQLCQKHLSKRLRLSAAVACTVAEVAKKEGCGYVLETLLTDGELAVGDEVVACGLQGPVPARIRALFVERPAAQRYDSVPAVCAARAVRVVGAGPGSLKEVVPGTQLYVVGGGAGREQLAARQAAALEELAQALSVQERGVHAAAPTYGALEAFAALLAAEGIPLGSYSIGGVRAAEVARASAQPDAPHRCILAFGADLGQDVAALAAQAGVAVLAAPVVYEVVAQYRRYEARLRAEALEGGPAPVFPVEAAILPDKVFCRHAPLLLGVEILKGRLRTGTPLCAYTRDGREVVPLGAVASIQGGQPPTDRDTATKGEKVAVKIVAAPGERAVYYGRHFTAADKLYSVLTRGSIDALKAHHKEDLRAEEWRLVIALKRMLHIDRP